jgi:aspartyl protease family protein
MYIIRLSLATALILLCAVVAAQTGAGKPGRESSAAVGRVWLYVVGALLLLPALCLATDVWVVAVTPGQSAAVVIGGGAPVTIEIGETVEGVTLLKADRGGAVLRVDGVTKTLPLVAEPSSVAGDTGHGTLTLSTDAHGQFFTSGAVNGRSMRFIVDTGATWTTLSRAQAQRIGLDYRSGTPTKIMTVNGVTNGWRVSLHSVRVGGMTVHDIDAIVVDNDTLLVGLLGMSFLGRFDMHRQGSTLVLRRRR